MDAPSGNVFSNIRPHPPFLSEEIESTMMVPEVQMGVQVRAKIKGEFLFPALNPSRMLSAKILLLEPS